MMYRQEDVEFQVRLTQAFVVMSMVFRVCCVLLFVATLILAVSHTKEHGLQNLVNLVWEGPPNE